MGWPGPNATNDEANKWGDLVYEVPEAGKKKKKKKKRKKGYLNKQKNTGLEASHITP